MPDDTAVVIKSDTPIIPGDLVAQVWMIIDPERKAKSVGDQSVSSSDDAEEMRRGFRRD